MGRFVSSTKSNAASTKKTQAPKKKATASRKVAAPKNKKKTGTTTNTAQVKKKKQAPSISSTTVAATKSASEAAAAKVAGRELAQSKSPAEFFADNQAIAGFDNPGKSLYTTLRELIENALDACESQRILPDISVKVEEMTQTQFNTWRSLVQEFNTTTKKTSNVAFRNTKNAPNRQNKRKKRSDDEAWGSDESKSDESESDSESEESIIESEDSDSESDDKAKVKSKKDSSSGKVRKATGTFDLETVFHGIDWLKHCPRENVEKASSVPDSLPISSQEEKNASSATNTLLGNTKRKRKSVGGTNSTDTEGRFFRVTVRDNGCGMAYEDIPRMLGRVLSSSKYGVRQTRGKFGLGAKMALIWSKKSTGVPIFVKSKQTKHGLGEDKEKKSKKKKTNSIGGLTTCVLDIDIYKNEPRILLHEQTYDEALLKEFGAQMGSNDVDASGDVSDDDDDDGINVDNLSGTEMCVVIGGNWRTYKAKIVQYLHQLAVITPYAKFKLEYVDLSSLGCGTDTSAVSSKRDMTLQYDRRSDQMPEPAKEVKHHPSSVNNLIMSRLLEQTKTQTLSGFLSKELSGISSVSAKKFCDTHLATNKSLQMDGDTNPRKLHDGQVTRLVQILRQQSSETNLFRTPDSSCLSPLGEYNLNLGIRKVIEPEYVATARDRPSAHEGHPFLVEAAVSLGGKDSKEGITITRFANRIPLLFEAGADVVTRVASSKIKWSLYKMDQKRDKIGVFVSIVSTKIPFKGTGKEYIGDDITEIQTSVKRALQTCCQQLRTHLAKRNAQRDIKERQSRLLKYVPDVGRAVFGLLDAMRQRQTGDGTFEPNEPTPAPGKKNKKSQMAADTRTVPTSLVFPNSISATTHSNLKNDITQRILQESLEKAIKSQKLSEDGEDAATGNALRKSLSPSKRKKQQIPLFIKPVLIDWSNMDPSCVLEHPAFTLRFFQPPETNLITNSLLLETKEEH